MNVLKPFERRSGGQKAKEEIQTIRQRIARSQEAVFKAIAEVGHPVNGMALARHLNTDSASITPRLAELRKKGKIKIAYVKHGLDGRKRNFYVVGDE